jgi:hypothetical protein
MITIRLNGGLGNQMFQFAAACALARRRSCAVRVDVIEFKRSRNRSYMLDRLNVPQEGLLQSHAYNRLRRFLGLEQIYREPAFHFDASFHDLQPPITLVGYFQSERYFSEISHEMRRMYACKAPLPPDVAAVAQAIERSPAPVAMHVRRGDYVDNPATARVHTSLGPHHYHQAVDILRGKLGHEPDVFLFSDDPQYVAQAFPFVKNGFVVRGDPQRPWEDLALMSHCRHHIIANSSLSWWGAWLSRSDGQIVIAPRNWFTLAESEKRLVKDLYLPHWLVM